MKVRKIVLALSAFLAACSPLAAESFLDSLDCSITVDAAYYPLSDHLEGSGDVFSVLTGPYSGLEGRVTANASYKIDTPLGDNFLLNGANVVLTGSFELSPVSVKPAFSASFTPVPFLVFSAGAQAGTGWDFLMFKGGMSRLNTATWDYEPITPFSTWFLKTWAQATFQFDTGAIFEGDWTHVLLQASYQVYYERLSSVADGDVWKWQCSGNKANGWQQYVNAVLAYQMPLVLKRAGILFEMSGHFADDDYNPAIYGGYDSAFQTISISPLLQFEFNEHNSLAVLFGFSSRRRFAEAYGTDGDMEPTLTCTGREWFFNRLALSYSYSF